jgi:hypothetical protein
MKPEQVDSQHPHRRWQRLDYQNNGQARPPNGNDAPDAEHRNANVAPAGAFPSGGIERQHKRFSRTGMPTHLGPAHDMLRRFPVAQPLVNLLAHRGSRSASAFKMKNESTNRAISKQFSL